MIQRPKVQKATKRRPVGRRESADKNATVTTPEEWVAAQEASFNATGNPIYVYQAFDRLNFRRLNIAIESADWEPSDPLPPLELPEWCKLCT